MVAATLLLVHADESAVDVKTLDKVDLSALVVTHIEIIAFASGLALFIVTFCGCVGALRENTFLLRMYSLTLGVLIVLCVVGAITVFFAPGQLHRIVKETLSPSLVQAYRQTVESEQIVDALQRQLRCCGMSEHSYRDWNANIYFNCSQHNPSHERCGVPHSCCRANGTGGHASLGLFCGQGVLNMSDHEAWYRVYMESCPDAATRHIKENTTILGGSCLVAAMLLLFIDMVTGLVIAQIDTIRNIYGRVRRASGMYDA
ncbi:hypothetical protein HPB48_008214 [Haemaphysalis longicornis]|uniref:Tetraspanin n=1 Tax=Haemaphysalis longicornis TaxID=44386 RepID=A0A9J6H1U1_HAELO|nr:hypothetical protein HPB48_008214 [Haemaphysalis longicornis]